MLNTLSWNYPSEKDGPPSTEPYSLNGKPKPANGTTKGTETKTIKFSDKVETRKPSTGHVPRTLNSLTAPRSDQGMNLELHFTRKMCFKYGK